MADKGFAEAATEPPDAVHPERADATIQITSATLLKGTKEADMVINVPHRRLAHLTFRKFGSKSTKRSGPAQTPPGAKRRNSFSAPVELGHHVAAVRRSRTSPTAWPA